MKSLVIFPSIRYSENFGKYAENFAHFGHKPDVMVINEEASKVNDAIAMQFTKHLSCDIEFYDKIERQNWFTKQLAFDANMIIPQKSHDELSFGLLVALTRKYDMVVFLDDDTYPAGSEDFLGEHWKRLSGFDSQVKVNRDGSCVNTHPFYHVRGFPYGQRPGNDELSGWKENCATVLNMGLWDGIPDLNAIDYLTYDFECGPVPIERVDDFHLRVGDYAPICSMNLAFKPEIIPAFYQLWDNNRYNDIFSGIFLKHIADHLGKSISIGNPLVYHDKAPRDYFKDAMTELPSIKLNEVLWKVVSEIELKGTSWLECYRELAEGLNAKFRESEFSDTIWLMTSKMRLWCETVEALMSNA